MVIGNVYVGINLVLSLVVLGLAVFGAITVATTRDDAFMVIDRQKQKWLLLCVGAAVAAGLSLVANIMMLWVVAAVIVGVYWQDVRPSIKDVLDNSSGSW